MGKSHTRKGAVMAESVPRLNAQDPSERINEAFDLMHRGESIRSVVVY